MKRKEIKIEDNSNYSWMSILSNKRKENNEKLSQKDKELKNEKKLHQLSSKYSFKWIFVSNF